MRPLLLACLVLLAPVSASTQKLTADDIARRVQDRDTGRDSRSTLRMKLFDRHGRARERALTMMSMRGGQAGAPDGDSLLIRFTYPADLKGTSFLVWEHPDADDERFLFLPSLARVRRIAGAETQESFVGTDFTYEDIGGRELDEYTYAIVDENRSWAEPGGSARPGSRIRSTPPRMTAPAMIVRPVIDSPAKAHPRSTATSGLT